jgi:hypothetical protein
MYQSFREEPVIHPSNVRRGPLSKDVAGQGGMKYNFNEYNLSGCPHGPNCGASLLLSSRKKLKLSMAPPIVLLLPSLLPPQLTE